MPLVGVKVGSPRGALSFLGDGGMTAAQRMQRYKDRKFTPASTWPDLVGRIEVCGRCCVPLASPPAMFIPDRALYDLTGQSTFIGLCL